MFIHVRSSLMRTHEIQAWNGAWVNGDYDGSSLRLSWHRIHKEKVIRKSDSWEVQCLPLLFGKSPPRRIPFTRRRWEKTTKRASLTLDQLRLTTF